MPTDRGASGTRRGARGSVLLLVPAAVLIIALLGGFAVDSAHLFLRQRHAHDVALHAANDAVGAGLDLAALRAGDGIVHDRHRVRAVALSSVEAAGRGVRLVEATIEPGGAILVTVEVDVERLFHPRLNGSRHHTIRASARAVGESRPG